MSVKQNQERICASKNEVLEAKLKEIAKHEKLDNYSLNMICDNYDFGLIYAMSGMVRGFVQVKESKTFMKVKFVLQKYLDTVMQKAVFR